MVIDRVCYHPSILLPGNIMIKITLKTSDQALSRIPKFARFLEVYNLTLKQDIAPTVIELSVNADLLAEVKQVTSLAYDFFEKAVISITHDLGE
jgi:hypothetical protein